MNEKKRRNPYKSPLKIVLIILVAIFMGPVLLSIGVSVIFAVISVALGLLVVALVMLSSPIIFMVFPGAIGINLPVMALFFFGIAMLALFVLFSAIVIRILRRGLVLILDGIKGLLGR
ncbi:MAG: hypothetical protein GX829_10620 [Clostridium sp.]|nr:hypothetical protein [Clostridium sp.]